MFLHVSVCPWGDGIPAWVAGLQAHTQREVEGSGGGVSRPTPRGKLRVWLGCLQAHTQGGSWGVWPEGGVYSPGGVSQHALRQTPQQTATAAGGTHPTGMHPCFNLIYNYLRKHLLIALLYHAHFYHEHLFFSGSTCEFDKRDNTNSFGGAGVPGITNPDVCRTQCCLNEDCVAYEWDTNSRIQ